ncbi:MAG: hypothetical protein JSW25_07005 [Thermoplasmata archaeon]|nr:MAG: hypothetical protein JSW25_07005 [Thermoplasmata archaeon]
MPDREEIPKLVATVLAKSPVLLLKVSWRYLRMKKRAQRAERTFRQRLEASGMDRETAARFAETYGSAVSIRKLLKETGIPGRVFGGNGKD